MKITMFGAAVLFATVGTAGVALAADMPARPYYTAPTPVYASAWAGAV